VSHAVTLTKQITRDIIFYRLYLLEPILYQTIYTYWCTQITANQTGMA